MPIAGSSRYRVLCGSSWVLAAALTIAAMFAQPSVRAAPSDDLESIMQQVEKESTTGKPIEQRANDLVIQITTGPTDARRVAMWEARIYGNQKPVVDALVASLEKGPPDQAAMAALALGHSKAKAAMPALTQSLSSSSGYVRESAAHALAILGDAAAVPALEKARPTQAGLSQWIFDDATATLKKAEAPKADIRTTLKGAGLFFFGGGSDHELRDHLQPFIEREQVRIWTSGPTDLNPQMGNYGGPVNAGEFYKLLADADGRPQVDAVFLSAMMPDEFPYELQWRLYQFMRRGGTVMVLGNAIFQSGRLTQPDGKLRRNYTYIPDLFHSTLPRDKDTSTAFRPFLAGMGSNVASGERPFGRGRAVFVRDIQNPQGVIRSWTGTQLEPSVIENLLRYAVEGDRGFPALVDLRSSPSKAQSGQPLAFSVNLFSALADAKASATPGVLTIDLLAGDRVVATSKTNADFTQSNSVALKPALATDWQLPDGEYTARLTLSRGDRSGDASTKIDIRSPVQIAWTIRDSYEDAGGELTGSATVVSKLEQTIDKATLVVELLDAKSRVLQRVTSPVSIKPGKSGAIPISLQARAYRYEYYPLVCRLEVDGKTVQRSVKTVCRTGPFEFDQAIAVGPFGGLDVSKPRERDLMLASGFNAIASRNGNGEPLPGWYRWGYDVAPKTKAKPMWPGDLIEAMGGAEWGKRWREREPGWTALDHWDEGDSEVFKNEGGDLVPGATPYYRNWLKAKYRSLDRLSAVWQKEADAEKERSKGKVEKPWLADPTSWNQIHAGGGSGGSPSEWSETSSSMWYMTLDQERKEFQRTNARHQLWHWTEIIHNRTYIGESPGTLAWQSQQSRAQFGNQPSTIMLHTGHPQKGIELHRRFAWGGLVGGARHYSVWLAGITEPGGHLNPGWGIWHGDYTMKAWWRPVADTLLRVRAKEQVLLDAWNSLSPRVAFLYHNVGGDATPRALFDALYFGGFTPDSLTPGTMRSERMDLSSFKVIIRVGKGDLPASWQERIAAWQKAGGTLMHADEFSMANYGGQLVEAEKGVQYWVGSDMARIASGRFAEYQTNVLKALAEKGVKPVVQVIDDAGLPAPAIEPALLETRDQSQYYVFAVADSDIFATQAFGSLDKTKFTEKIDLAAGVYDGAKFTVTGKSPAYRVWLRVAADKPFDTRVTVDGKGPIAFRTMDKIDFFRTERGLAKPQAERWIAGPAFAIAAGEHTLKVEHRASGGDTVPAGIVKAVMIIDEPMIEPRIKPVAGVENGAGGAPVKAVYALFADRLLDRDADGSFRMPIRQADGEICSLITEDLGPLKLEPRLIRSASDQLVQVKINVTKQDGTLSACRHSLAVSLLDSKGNVLTTANSSARGWRIAALFPAFNDPPIPWKVTVKDLTSGRSAEATIDSSTPTGELLTPDETLPGVALRPADHEPMTLDGDVHFVPVRVTLTSNEDKPIEGVAKIELPPDLLMQGGVEQPVKVAPRSSTTITWPCVISRDKALQLNLGMMEWPRRCWVTLADGRRLETVVDTMWIRQWEKQPAWFTDLKPGKAELRVLNFLDKPVSAKVAMTLPEPWRVIAPPGDAIELAAGSADKPAVGTLAFEAAVKPEAAVSPVVARVAVKVSVGDRVYDGGGVLVDTEKRRTWWLAKQVPLEGLESGGGKTMPTEAIDAKSGRLLGLGWEPFESDTMIDLPCEIARSVFAATNVKFADAGKVRVRVRGNEKVQVWLAGKELETGAPGNVITSKGEDALDIARETSVQVPAGKWLPLVVRYERQTAYPSTDLVFLDEQGKVIWSAMYRAKPAD